MQLYQHFDQLIYDANALPVGRSIKEPLISALQYLRTQTLCDLDRRDQSTNYKEAWQTVEKHFKQLAFHEYFKKPEEFYDPIYRFVGVGAYEVRYARPLPTPPRPSPFLNWTALQMLEEMVKESTGVGSPQEKMKLKKDLSFLVDQAKKTLANRHQSAIQVVWREIHPRLKSYALLRKFEAEPMRSRLMKFLKG